MLKVQKQFYWNLTPVFNNNSLEETGKTRGELTYNFYRCLEFDSLNGFDKKCFHCFNIT